MTEHYLLVMNWNDSNYGNNQSFRLYPTLGKVTEVFEEEKEEFIKQKIEENDFDEEQAKEYREELSEMFDLMGDYEMSCVDTEGEWNLYVLKVYEYES